MKERENFQKMSHHWRQSAKWFQMEVGDGSFFFFAFFTLFHLSITFFLPEVPFKEDVSIQHFYCYIRWNQDTSKKRIESRKKVTFVALQI